MKRENKHRKKAYRQYFNENTGYSFDLTATGYYIVPGDIFR